MYGHTLPDGMADNQRLPAPIITPTSKADDHDLQLTPDEILVELIDTTSKVYIQAFETITGQPFEPPPSDEPLLDRIRRNLAAYRA